MDTLLDANFQWDGTSSDLAQQFYRVYTSLSASTSLPATATAPAPLPFTTDDLPDAVRRRLASTGLLFEQLPSLLQRALLWDAGLVFGNGRDLLQVYTTGNRSMAQLAVPLESFRRAGCSALNCTSQFRSQYCSGAQMLSVATCVTDNLYGTATNTAMWATGPGQTKGETTALVVPEMRVLRHQWVDGPNATSYLVYAIHTVPEQNQPAWSRCPAANLSQATGLTVPCGVYTAQRDPSTWQQPPPSALVSTWLELTKQELSRSDGLDTGSIIGAACGGVLVVVVLAVVVRWWWCYDGDNVLPSKSSMTRPRRCSHVTA